jgi:hypothetical protein
MGEKDRLDQITGASLAHRLKCIRQLAQAFWSRLNEVCLAFELRKLGYKFEQQKPLAVI